jgi:membrane associated rhomboid family serine protease
MREPGEVVAAAFPRPGRALKAVLVAIAFFAIAGAIVWNWAPGPPAGAEIFSWVAFQPHAFLSRPWMVWTLLTSGILTNPEGLSHALWSLVGLYFLTNDLEKKWGGARLLRFLAVSVVMGNLMVLAADLALPKSLAFFHPPFVLGPLAAITATAMAWAKENATRQIRLFFFLPISGKTLYWVTIGGAVLALLFMQGTPEGAGSLFGGILAGIMFGGTPSPVRSAWLRVKLAFMRRQGHALTVESITSSDRPRAPKRTSKGGPPLRVVQGGLDDDLKNRKPPKDKRYLN